MSNLILEAKRLVDTKGSGRVGQADWTMAQSGVEIEVYHSITGSNMGIIDLRSNEMIPTKPSYSAALSAVLEYLIKSAENTEMRAELALLMHFPAKNIERQTALKLALGIN